MEAIPVKIINPYGEPIVQIDTLVHDADSSTLFLNAEGVRIENLPLWAWEYNNHVIYRRLQEWIDHTGYNWADISVDFLQDWVTEVVREAEQEQAKGAVL